MNSVLTSLAFMYVTLMPVIFAGILNMVFCKLPILGFLKKPIDAGKNFTDGRRIFGDNKTWKGFAGYVILGTLMTVIWGLICKASPVLASHDFFYMEHENKVTYNLLCGVLIGIAYALFELPNSFLKRRLGIEPGKTMKGWQKVLFVFLDQADSIFGCVLVVCIFHPLPVWFYFVYVIVGAVTHIIFNMLLYFAHLRKNMF